LIFAGRRADTECVVWVELVLAIVLMPLAGYALIALWKAGGWLNEARRKDPPPEPIASLAADLRRLRAELEDTETRARLTAKHHRVRALRGAYLDALGAACRRLELAPPAGGDGASLAEIYRVESELRQRGLDVRSGTAAR
jgi:fructose-1,6-bisphosphatase/inositol monophosphatase family enzyme